MVKMISKLIVLKEDLTFGTEYPIVEDMLIGRGNKCNIRFKDPSVSRIHAKVSVENGMHIITNISKTNPTFVNNMEMSGSKHLSPGNLVSIGDSLIVFQSMDTDTDSWPQILTTSESDIFNTPQHKKQDLDGTLTIIGQDGKLGTQFQIVQDLSIGRDKNCHVRINLDNASRIHSIISIRNGKYVLNHVSTSNPTFLNSHPILKNQILEHGDVLTISDRSFLFRRLQIEKVASPCSIRRKDSVQSSNAVELMKFTFEDHHHHQKLLENLSSPDIAQLSPIRRVKNIIRCIDATAPKTSADVRSKVLVTSATYSHLSCEPDVDETNETFQFDSEFVQEIKLSPILKCLDLVELDGSIDGEYLFSIPNRVEDGYVGAEESKYNICDGIEGYEFCTNKVYFDIENEVTGYPEDYIASSMHVTQLEVDPSDCGSDMDIDFAGDNDTLVPIREVEFKPVAENLDHIERAEEPVRASNSVKKSSKRSWFSIFSCTRVPSDMIPA